MDVTTTIQVNQECRELVFDGISFQNVEVSIENSGQENLEWIYDGEKIRLFFGESPPIKTLLKVRTQYLVEDPVSGMIMSVPDEFYPRRKVFAITDHETERAKYWLACIDQPAIRTIFDFWITSEPEYTILANGLFQAETINGKRKTAHWKLDQPCPSYLCCIAVGEFVEYKDGDVHGIPLVYYAVKGTPIEILQRSFGDTGKIMKFLEKTLKQPFPFPKYYQIVVPKIGGAMENISLTTWDEIMVVDEKWAREYQYYTDMINCHEMAHSYFGDAIVMRHFEHAWLKESWASYMQMLWLREKYGDDSFHYQLYQAASAYFSECERYVRPVVCRKYDSSWHLFDAHLYPGGAWRLHMLSKKLGDLFWRGVQDYVSTYMMRTVETDDFRKMLEKHSFLNLTKFFDQWIYGRGFPKLKGTYTYDASSHEVKISLQQTQMDEKQGINFFDIELEVEVIDSNNSLIKKTIKFEGDFGSVTFNTTGKPKEIRFDPDTKVLFSLDFSPGEDLLVQSLNNGNIFHKIWALKELVKKDTRSSLNSVRQAILNEDFYGIRNEAVANLSKSHSPYALDILLELLEKETHPIVQTSITRCLCTKRDKNVESALLGLLQSKTDLPYRAKAFTLEGLGFQRNDEYFALLIKEANDDGYLGIVRNGALRGIGNLRTNEAFEFLLQRIKYGNEREESHATAILSFSKLAKWFDEKERDIAIESLTSLLSMPIYGVPRNLFAVAEGLQILNASSQISDIERIKNRIPTQDHAIIQRHIKQIKAKSKGNVPAKLEDEISRLSTKIRDLERRIDELNRKKTKPNENQVVDSLQIIGRAIIGAIILHSAFSLLAKKLG